MTIPALPNLSPNGVIQNPGIGQIMGQGLGNLAQFLQAKQQMEQQRQLAQQQLGQGQQRIDLEKAQQDFQRSQIAQAQQQEQAKQAEQQRIHGVIGQALQLLQPQQVTVPGMDASPVGQLGGPSVQGYQAPANTGTTDPTLGQVSRQMDPADVSSLLASPEFKAYMELRKNDAEASKPLLGKPGETPIDPKTGLPMAPQLAPEAKKLPDKSEVVLERMGLPVDTDGPTLARMGRLGEFNNLMSKENKETTTQPNTEKAQSAFAVKFGGGLADQLVSEMPIMRKASQSLATIDQMRAALKSGINAGWTGAAKQAFGQAAAALGWANDATTANVNNTQVYGGLAAKMMGETAKDFASRGLTQADIKFVQDAMGANKSWNPASLLNLLDFEARLIREKGSAYNEDLNKIPADEVDPKMTGLAKVDLTGGMPRTKTFLINGQNVAGTLDDRTGRYIGTVDGRLGYLDGGPQ